MPVTSTGLPAYDRRPRAAKLVVTTASAFGRTDMPSMLVKQDSRICVHKKSADGKPRGDTKDCHCTLAEAQAQQRALYVHADKSADGGAADLLAYPGSEVKALGNGRVAGWLVRFGSPDQPDTSDYRDYFTPDTDFGIDEWPAKTAVY